MIVSARGLQQTTNYKIVIPFYAYAAISLVVGTILLFLHTDVLYGHYFNPKTLAIVHTMALGWGTMVILGASHQLLPVLIESKLDSEPLAFLTFLCTAIGIPILVYGFYVFNLGWVAQLGAILVNIGVALYLVNVISSAFKSEKRNVHAWYIIVAALWLFSTTFFGLLLLFNFTHSVFAQNSVQYLSLHAHMGILGWFLMLVLGVGSRLIPMFLISMYSNEKLLWYIFVAANASILLFVSTQLFSLPFAVYCLSLISALAGVGGFVYYCYRSYKVRIRKGVDDQMKLSLTASVQMLFPIAVMLLMLLFSKNDSTKIATLYGFTIFFGWLTAIVLGMTFKTLPFIIWNIAYHKKAHKGKTPAPKDLFNESVFRAMQYSYLAGFIIFILAYILEIVWAIKLGALLLLIAACLYSFNTFKIILHKPNKL